MNFRHILESLHEAIIVIDALDDIEYVNPSFSRLMGFDTEEAVGINIIHFFKDNNGFDAHMHDLKHGGSSQDKEVFLRHKDGRTIPAVQNLSKIEGENSTLYCITLRDLSEFDEQRQRLSTTNLLIENSNERLERQVSIRTEELSRTKAQRDLILKTIDETLWSIDHESMAILYVSCSIERLFGRKEEEFYHNPNLWQELIHEEDKPKVEAFFINLKEGAAKEIDFQIIRPDGQTAWIKSRVTYNSKSGSFVGISHDITEQKVHNETLAFLTYHDPLTRLPNRTRLKESLELLIEKSRVISTRAALLYLDIDTIKEINDTKGHDVGDRVLQALSSRFKTAIKEELIRFSGDEFVILMSDLQDSSYAERLATRLFGLLDSPFEIEEDSFKLNCCIGISFFPEHATNSIELIKHANAAMYEAKKTGQNSYHVYPG